MRLLILPLLLISFVVSGQTYADYIARAQRGIDTLGNANRKNIKKPYEILAATYDSALAISKANDGDIYNAACAHSLVGHVQKATALLREAFERGYDDFDWMIYDRDLNAIRHEKIYLELEKKYRPDSIITFFDILEGLNASDEVIFCGKRISIGDQIFDYTMNEIRDRVSFDMKLTADSLIDFSGKSLTICKSRFDNDRDSYNSIERMSLKELAIDNSRGRLAIENMRVNTLTFHASGFALSNFKKLMFDHLTVDGFARIDIKGDNFLCLNSTFNLAVPKEDDYRWGLVWNLDYGELEIANTTFNNSQQEGLLYPLEFQLVDTKWLRIQNSKFNHDTRIWGSIGEVLSIRNNSFPRHVDISNLKLPDFNCYFPFSQLDNSRIVKFDITKKPYLVRGDSIADYSNDALSDEITAIYKRMYDSYRNRADITSANSVYVKMKDIEIVHLKSIEHRTLEQTMRLRLNQLMGFYTDHATSPGKALIISFYIILAFGVFYCFFPSEWDKTSKSKVITDFKLFIEKNEHGYVKPFFKMMRGLFISLLNATALSMNAFITLGFGNIPTTGIARYMCIIQGMIGWFLLSLFTVALLNQVLL